MSRSRISFLALVSALYLGCGGGGEEGAASSSGSGAPSGAAARPSGRGACALLMQSEVDEIFGTSVGAGTSETLEGGAELCTWPSGEDPALLLQIGPVAPNVEAAVDLGEGYRVEALAGMSGPAAMALELPVEGAGEASVAIVAMNVEDRSVTLSPVGLGLRPGTQRFERLKEIVELVARRP